MQKTDEANRPTRRPLDRLERDPAICGGSLRVKGTRLTVAAVLHYMSSGYEVSDLVREFPVLEDADVRQCAKWGAWLTSYQRIDSKAE